MECERPRCLRYLRVADWNFSQFEELVEQFIPSDPTWKGWVKMALHQPFFEVIPVARELISKTKRIAAKSVQQSASTITPHRPKPMKTSERPLPKTKDDPGPSNILANPFTDEPETMSPEERPKIPSQITRNGGPIHRNSHDRDRPRVTSMFRRSTTSHSRGTSNGDNVSAFLVLFTRVLMVGAEHRIVDILSAQHCQQRQPHDPFTPQQYHYLRAKPP